MFTKKIFYRVLFKLPTCSTRVHSTNLSKNQAEDIQASLLSKFPYSKVTVIEEAPK